MLRWFYRGAIGTAAFLFATVVYTWITLPDTRRLKRENPGPTAFMQMRADQAKAAGKPVRFQYRWVGYDQIANNLKRAVLLAEDAAFWSHDGIDYAELRAALADTVEKGEALRGASTITQQLAKNLYLSPSRNPYRKLSELFLARRLEAQLSKRRILELYLNVIEWGDGIWGAEAASHAYFGIPASDLSADQAALMAGALINPRVYNPGHPNARLARRQEIILRKMGAYTGID